jgi:hypothetical protein
MTLSDRFSASYAQARAKFAAAAEGRGLLLDVHELPGHRGSDGETLTMDVARLGGAEAAGVLLITSATHGIEGYCGSGCQIALLADDAFVAALRDASLAVVLVHAVNPYGFSHGRRVNEDNVDLNRNFRDFRAPLPENPAYDAIHSLLVPATWPPPAENEAKIGAYIAQHGQRAWQAAVSTGQHAHVDGLFYGGVAPTWSNRTLRAVLRAHGARCRRLAWIDIHTGLGPRGHGEKIYAGRDGAADLDRAKRWWGEDITSIYDGSSTSAQVTGTATLAAYDECPQAEYSAIGLEYGTRPLPEVFNALRADHWRHNHPEASAEQRAAIGALMRAAFYDEAADWHETVYAQARGAAQRALQHLAAR